MKDKWIGHNTCFEWYSKLERDNLVLSFKGEFNHELVKAILALTEQYNSYKGLPNRVFGVILECLQNVCKHGARVETEKKIRSGIVLMGKQNKEFLIGVGNFVKNDQVDKLKSRYDKVNSLDEEGLRQMQHEILVNSSLTEDGNAGIGIIYMARKTEGKMKYRFQELDENVSFFSLQLSVKF